MLHDTVIPNLIEQEHWQEWRDSQVSPDIIAANIISLQGTQPYDRLLYSSQISRRNDGRVVDWILRRYQHVESGGWWCAGEDIQALLHQAQALTRGKAPTPATFQKLLKKQERSPQVELADFDTFESRRSDWGQFKPQTAYVDKEGKEIKYEAPPKTETRLTCLFNPANPRFWLEVLANPEIPILIVEGAKKAGALLSLGYAAIALPGIFNGYRAASRQLIAELAAFACPKRDFLICFDHDLKPKTVKNVELAIERLGTLLQQSGCRVSVIELPGPEKGVDDFIASRGPGAFAPLYQSALPLSYWLYRRLCCLRYAPDLTVHQRYLEPLDLPPEAKLIGLKAPKGTGKTEVLAKIAGESVRDGIPVLLVGHRVQLVQAICDRIGVPYVTEVRASETGQLLGYGLCADSLHPQSQAQFNAENWHDCLVLIDESEQVFWHVLNAATEVRQHRVEVLNQLKQLFVNVLASQRGRIFLSDADLSDLSIDFVRGLAQFQVKPWIVLNTWKPEVGWRIYNYGHSTPAEWLAALIKAIGEGGRHLICTDSQKPKGKYSTYTLERLLKLLFPHLRILRIDSKTIIDPSHPAYGAIANLNAVLQGYDIVLCSPSLETGVSIDLKGHFSACWGVFQGVTPENSLRQSLGRLREGVDRHLWIAPYGLERIGNGSTSLKSLLACEHRKTKAHVHLLQDAGLEVDEAGEINLDRTALTVWGKMACRINLGMLSYREIALAELKAEGHRVVEFTGTTKEGNEANESLEQCREEGWQAQCQAIAAAEDCTTDEYERLKAKTAKSEAEQLQERKFQVVRRYGEVSPELVRRDDEGWYRRLRLAYFLEVGQPYLKERDRQAAAAALHGGKAWIPDFNRSQMGAKVGVLLILGIPKLLDSNRAFRGTDQDLIDLAKAAKAQSWDLKASLRVGISQRDSPITVFKKLLALLGLDLRCDGRDRNAEGKPNAGVRYYQLVGLDDGRAEIFQRWLVRDAEAQVSLALPQAAIAGTPAVDPAQVNTDLNSVDGSPEQTEQRLFNPGAIVRWTRRLGTWIVESLSDGCAQVRSTSGWAAQVLWSAPVGELELLSDC